ncbi:thymidylate synthase [Nocardia amamiensis]|uniref:thymidylate synthase n=1 Tax=Nocardia amamiensis TaxID=404578 RepID=UPI000833CCA4|nr:thymidylate synthase [Nocardia amamiensis]
MFSVTADSANELFAATCTAVCRNGADVSPRGMATTEVLGAHLHLRNPRRRLVDLPPARVINPAFAVAETLWILSGSDDPWIFRYNRTLSRYSDDGRLQGAYGPRMRRWRGRIDQLDRVRDILTRDRDSRQAVIQLFDPERDTRGHRDVPCTLGYRFFIRHNRLHMHTTMRSQDLWLGFPYDLFAATILQELLAGWLGVALGEYHHFVDSLHLYDKHVTAAHHLDAAPTASPSMPPISVAWDDLGTVLDTVIAGREPGTESPMWASFATVMASYLRWADGDRLAARTMAAGVQDDLGRALERWYEHLSAKTALMAGIAGPLG